VDPLWSDSYADPRFVLTADQDWAPEWAMERFLAFLQAEEIPVHIFVTNPSPALEAATRDSRVTLGAHPNFLPGSSHGSTPEQIVESIRGLVPDADTFRTHTYAESAGTLDLMRSAGFRTDSNLCLFLQPRIVPLIHATGLLRLPVFLDDDSLLLWDRDGKLDLGPMAELLVTPGLKILNFHPVLFAINCPSARHYRDRRKALYEPASTPPDPFDGRGVADVLAELIATARGDGSRLSSFPEVAASAWDSLSARRGRALYGWGEGA
jgi:hypothetical protein